MKETSYAVLGMGRYGSKLALTLAGTGAEILIADRNSQIVNEYADSVTRAVSLDLGNPVALQEIGLDLTDIVIIDLSEDLEDTIMCTMIAREKGVKTIIATPKSTGMIHNSLLMMNFNIVSSDLGRRTRPAEGIKTGRKTENIGVSMVPPRSRLLIDQNAF